MFDNLSYLSGGLPYFYVWKNRNQAPTIGTPPPRRNEKGEVILDVVNGVTNCPDCGVKVRVTNQNPHMVKHVRANVGVLCLQTVLNTFNVISKWVDPKQQLRRRRTVKKKQKQKTPVQRPYVIDHTLDREYPVSGSQSVHAMPVGLPSAGKNRKH